MTLTTLGDAAQYFQLRRNGTDLKTQLGRLTSELSSGTVSDVGDTTGGRFSALSDVTRGLALNRSFADGLSIAALQADGRQAALERIAGELDAVAPRLLSFATGGSLASMDQANADAPARLETVVATLNIRLGGVALFGGDRSDAAPVISAEEMLTALRPLVATSTTAADVIDIVDSWFLDSGGGFETAGWQGGAGQPPPVILGEGDSTQAAITALDPALRETLGGLALAALAAEGAGPGDADGRRALVTAAAERIQTASDGLVGLSATLGTAQARIDEARARTEASRTTLKLEESRILGADPFETATALQALETQLQTHYLLTSRLSRLSLSEYLR